MAAIGVCVSLFSIVPGVFYSLYISRVPSPGIPGTNMPSGGSHPVGIESQAKLDDTGLQAWEQLEEAQVTGVMSGTVLEFKQFSTCSKVISANSLSSG
jgi:hypothetical protein